MSPSRGLIEATQAGLTREIGVSNYSPAQIDELIAATGEVPVVNQIEWSPFGHRDDALAHAREQTWEVNVMGTVLGIRASLAAMFERDGGAIVAVASIDATFGEQQLVSYCTSKGAVPMLARTAALDLHAKACGSTS